MKLGHSKESHSVSFTELSSGIRRPTFGEDFGPRPRVARRKELWPRPWCRWIATPPYLCDSTEWCQSPVFHDRESMLSEHEPTIFEVSTLRSSCALVRSPFLMILVLLESLTLGLLKYLGDMPDRRIPGPCHNAT